MHRPTGQAMDQPGVDGAEPRHPSAGHAIQKPLHLRSGKHRVDGQAGQRLNPRRVTGSDQARAVRGGPAALPAHDGAERFARGCIPNGDRLALVGDRESQYVRRRSSAQAGCDRVLHRLPDAKWALLHPAGLRVFDTDGRRAAREYLSRRRNEDGLGICRALINGENCGCHGTSSRRQL
jgi:hypothetical protein